MRPKVRNYIFNYAGGRPVTVWMRIQEHQLESLRQVATGVLLSTPQYEKQDAATLGLNLPGELRLQRLQLRMKLTLYCSMHNRGAKEAAMELKSRLGHVNSFVTEDPSSLSDRGTTMLLYLNKRTWAPADDGSPSPLADEVTQALQGGVHLVLIHEADEAREGCSDFGVFFQTTCAWIGPASHPVQR